MFNPPQVILEMLGRDEFKLDESKVWPNFTDREHMQVEIVGIVLVPGKFLIGVGKPVDGLTEVPVFALAKNNWPYSTRESMEFADSAVTRRGSAFRDIVGNGNKCKQQTIKCRFAESPFTVYYVGFDVEVILNFQATIVY